MAVEQTNDLKQIFFDEYEGFADKRIKKIENDSVFTIDDRSPKDRDAKKQLFSWFCQMFARVVDQDTVKITLRGGVPASDNVVKWLKAHGATSARSSVGFLVKRGDQAEIASLAAAIRAITDSPYEERAYKYVCPRVGKSLDRLHTVLDKAWL